MQHPWSRLSIILLLWLGLPSCTLDRSPVFVESSRGGATAAGTGAGATGQAGSGGVLSGSGGTGAAPAPPGDAGVVPGPDAAVVGGETAAPPQGYSPGAVGAPCQADAECQAGRMSRTCFTESTFAPLLYLPDGYCGKLCDLSLTNPCEPGAACINLSTLPPVFVCMRSCRSDADCRVQEGYTCNMPFTSTQSVCSLGT